MSPGRRYPLLLAILVAVACALGAYRLCGNLLADVDLPWRAGLSWQQMEGLTGAQVITSVAVRLEVDPAEGKLSGEASVGIATPGGDGTQVALLLNRGLGIDEITCDGKALAFRRHDERILVQLPEGTGECTLVVAYRGRLTAGNDAPLIIAEDEFVADRLQFWYPVDLKSFPSLAVTATVPEDFEVVWSGTLEENQVQDGRRTVQWEEIRPVLAAGFAAGRYQKVSRVQGTIRCNVFGRNLDEVKADGWLGDLGDAYNYFHAQLGSDGFNQLNLVVSDRAPKPSHLGGPMNLCSPNQLEKGDDAFVVLAHEVARNWWGDTVSGRWFSARPEAGEWLLTGLSEYSAWQALRTLKGRRAYLRHQEALYCPPEIPGPMKVYNLERRLLPPDQVDERLFTVRGPYTAAMLAAYIGPDAFSRACRNFMSVHRYTTVSYAALLHEMTLASEKPLDELVRVWFDRPGTLDYAIAGVTEEGGRVHVTVENVGDIPAYVPMELGLVTEDGYDVQTIEPGTQGDTLSFNVAGPLKRVVLDPEFAMADMRRTNNIWPPTQWPQSLTMSKNGRIALLSQSEWGGDHTQRLYIFSLAGRTPELAAEISGAKPFALYWDDSSQELGVQREGTVGILRANQWHRQGGGDVVMLGWGKNEPIFWEAGKISEEGGTEVTGGPLAPRPVVGVADIQSGSGKLVYITEDGVLVVRDPVTHAITVVRENVRAAGNLRWRDDSDEIMYFESDGALVSVKPDSPVVTTLLKRNYPISQARISVGAKRVAWVDPAGLLRGMSPGDPEPVYISLPGEVIDFAWEGADALIALVATIPRRLPMRFHADYTLWRIPVSTWRGVQLPYDPVAFAKAAREISLLEVP